MRHRGSTPRHDSSRRSGFRFVKALVVLVVFVAPYVASVDVPAADEGRAAVELCHCGCGNPEGRCCCAARSTSRLGMSCSQRDDAPIEIGSSDAGKFVGPAPSPVLPGILPAHERLVDIEPARSEFDPSPEVPPPRT